jgi:thioesterase domain-containing protein
MPDDSTLTTRLQTTLDGMPPVVAMGVRVHALDAGGLTLTAPLARNVNDKACAFGGSLAGLLTLAGWGTLAAALWRDGVAAEVYIAESELKYLAPLYGDLVAHAAAPSADDLAVLRQKLAERGRGGLWLTAEARDANGAVVARLRGRYAALRPA